MQDKPLELEQLLDHREWAIKKPIDVADPPSNIIVTVYSSVQRLAFPEGGQRCWHESLWTLTVQGCAGPVVQFVLQVAMLPRSRLSPAHGRLVIIKQKKIALCTLADCSIFNVYPGKARISVSIPSRL